MTSKELSALIRNNQIPGVLLLSGNSPYVKQKMLSRIVSALVPVGMEDFNLTVFDKKNTDMRDVFDVAMQFPMMSEKRVVIVDDFSWSSLSDSALGCMEDNIPNLPETTVLVFRQEVNAIQKKGNSKKALALIEKYGQVCEANKLAGTELYTFLMGYAKKMGCVLSRTNAEYLVSQAGDEENMLINELSKICNYVNGNESDGEVKKSHIDLLATKTLETKVYLLTDNLLKGMFDRAYEVYDILVKQKTEPEYLLGIIAGTFIEMYRVKVAGTYKHSRAELMEAFDYKNRDFVLAKAEKNVRNYTVAQLKQAIDLLAEADLKLKTARDDGYLIIEQLMVKLTLIITNNG